MLANWGLEREAKKQGLQLVLSEESATGFKGVYQTEGTKPFQAKVRQDGTLLSLGTFATAAESFSSTGALFRSTLIFSYSSLSAVAILNLLGRSGLLSMIALYRSL